MSFAHPYKAIVAVAEDGVIGRGGDLPWRLSEDLKWFKRITLGHTILMGRKTWESLPGALPSRQNWVLSRTANQKDGMSVFRSMEEVQQALGPSQTLFIIGGGEIYSMALPLCHELFISEVRRKVPDGDAFFPNYKDQFRPVEVLDDNPDFLLRRWVRV
ncbi:MAG: dihydrofolate reductase [Verrucomicrobia bacterium]|jgi:dihydrofolate reductase|nr:dihydrofolate reductase [Verrucomicrobiota bacterium]MDA1077612.1 dihydrofolate reductase [Verrucomicrobiota bacterium]